MKKYIYLLVAVMAGMLGSCSKENPFENEFKGDTGGLLTAALDVSLQSADGPRSLREGGVRKAAPSVNLFKVAIFEKGETEPCNVFNYNEMPEIVTLPVGEYSVKAYYGDNLDAAWDAPYYEGESEFVIEKDKITETVAPVVCTVRNVRVSIKFSAELREVMESDCNVAVKVGEVGSLDFTVARVDNGESGYFRFVEGSNTLAATFTGTVDSGYTSETKTGIDVEPGKHYIITFRLHSAGAEGPGGIVSPDDSDLIVVDATVVEEPIINGNVDVDEAYQEDDLRPKEEDTPGKDEPSTPVDPSTPAPEITAGSPIQMDREFQIPLDAEDRTEVPITLDVKSHAPGGITRFEVKIISAQLTKEELERMNFTDELDLVNPGKYTEVLQAFGFLPGGKTTLKGETDVHLEITDFIPMLVILGNGTHNFQVTVGDEYGTTVKTLILKINK